MQNNTHQSRKGTLLKSVLSGSGGMVLRIGGQKGFGLPLGFLLNSWASGVRYACLGTPLGYSRGGRSGGGGGDPGGMGAACDLPLGPNWWIPFAVLVGFLDFEFAFLLGLIVQVSRGVEFSLRDFKCVIQT